MRDSQELRDLLSVEVKEDDIQEIFKDKKIEKTYRHVRDSSFVVQYHSNAMEQLKQQWYKRFPRINDLLADKEVIEYNEKIIKTKLFNTALNKILNHEANNLDTALLLTISEENLIKVIDELEEILDQKVQELYNKIVQDVIFRVGLKFLD